MSFIQNKIVALAFNYLDLNESEKPQFDYPAMFMKSPTSLIHSGDEIRVPKPLHEKVWPEVELAIQIARNGRIYYGVANDVSAFNVNNMDVHLAFSKAIDTFCPISKYFRHFKSDGDILRRRMTTKINGKLVQDGNTSLMFYKPIKALRFIEEYITLYQGDIVLTGTCKHDKSIMYDGDIVEVEIEGIGKVTNKVVYV